MTETLLVFDPSVLLSVALVYLRGSESKKQYERDGKGAKSKSKCLYENTLTNWMFFVVNKVI